MNYQRKTLLLILIATIARMIVAIAVELGNDEVYYRLYAEHLQWNYFDHPPMVGWLIRFTTLNLFVDTGLTIRLGAILCSAATTWLLYKCGERLSNAYAGFLAALLYTATIYGSIIAGTFILPDSPQMVCWAAALLLLIKITESKTITKKCSRDILWFGVVTGLGMLCKIHTVFLWFGFGWYILLYRRHWLQHWAIYAAAIITIIFFIPVIIWNIQNDFITFLYHGKRVDVASGGMDIESLLTFTGGQIFYCNPIVFFIIIRAIWHRDLFVKPSHRRVLLLAALPLIFLATAISLFKNLLPHWTGPAYAALILLTACYYSRKRRALLSKRQVPLSFNIANGLLLLVVVSGIAVIHFFPGTLGEKKMEKKGDGDFTLDMYGWKNFSNSFDSIYHSTHNAGGKAIIVADKWFPAAHIDFYVAQPLHIQTIALGPVDNIHQYHWLNKQRGLVTDSTDIYIISPSNYLVEKENISALKNIVPNKIDTIIQYRNKLEARRFYVYYFKKDRYHFNPSDY